MGKDGFTLEPTSEIVAGWLKGNFRSAVKEYFTDEIAELWNDFVGDTPELDCEGGPDFMPDADFGEDVTTRKAEVEKVLAFKPVADDFINQQEDAIEEYVSRHVEYLKTLLADNVGSGIGRTRADLILQLSDEISVGPDDPPPLLVALYCVKHGNRLKG
jgi:hypothetical protein